MCEIGQLDQEEVEHVAGGICSHIQSIPGPEWLLHEFWLFSMNFKAERFKLSLC